MRSKNLPQKFFNEKLWLMIEWVVGWGKIVFLWLLYPVCKRLEGWSIEKLFFNMTETPPQKKKSYFLKFKLTEKWQDTMLLWSNSSCISLGGRGFESCRCRFPSIFASSYWFAGSHSFASSHRFFTRRWKTGRWKAKRLKERRWKARGDGKWRLDWIIRPQVAPSVLKKLKLLIL